MKGIFIDGTFKYCPKYFYQLYSLHGCKNGNAIALVFALLPAKSGNVIRPFFPVRLNTVLVHLDSKNCQQGHEGMFFLCA
jgi:hypothetical protein